VHIAFGVDDKYVRGMGVAITSLVANNPGTEFVFHVFYGSIDEADFDRLDELARKLEITIFLNALDKEIFAKLATFGHYTHAIYNRLVISERLRGVATRALYIDADIVCLAGVRELIAMDLGSNVVAAVADVDRIANERIRALGLKCGKYFNSGVILIDIEKWNEEDVSNTALSILLDRNNNLVFPDQDALNIALDGRVACVDRKWNRLYDLGTMTEKIADDTVFLHYAAGTKPWFAWCLHPLKSHFIKYYQQSPWASLAFDPPRDYKEMRTFARGLSSQGHYAAAIVWHLKSLRKRLAKKFGRR
jgi:lipopolysaccharide biosynthesis glycosyltransferase